MLRELGIIIGTDTKAGAAFESLFPSFLTVEYTKPSEYVSIYWNEYQKLVNGNSNLNGKVFEYILATLCIREKILPFYLSAKVTFVPNVVYDQMFYTKERGPICWSIKTSLRERYKQADLESIALKYVHRRSLSYLITLDEKEANGVKQKIKTGDVIGLDKVVVATTPEFDDLITDLKNFEFHEPKPVNIIDSSQIVTMERVDSIINK
jgi:hypothetical protein